MNPTDTLKITHWEDADLVVMARLYGADASLVTQATISSIAGYVYDVDTGDQVGDTLTLTVVDAIFDALQTDSRWTEDSTGYNFRYTVGAAYFPTGARLYRIEFVFTPASGAAFPLVAEVYARDLYSS